MTTHALNAGGVRRHASSLVREIGRWMTDAASKRRVRREMAGLPRLPTHLLRDMGLERYAELGQPDSHTHRSSTFPRDPR